MDPTPPGTISPGAIDGSHGSFSYPDDSSGLEDCRYQAYFLLKFPDGSWLMRTRSVVIGRDDRLRAKLEERQSAHVDAQAERGSSDYAPSENSADTPDASDDEGQPGEGTKFKYSHCGGIRSTLPPDLKPGDKQPEVFLPIHPPVDEDSGDPIRLGAISKRHARLEVRPSGVYLEVLGRNGLFVNNEHIRAGLSRKLDDGDRMGIGGLDFEIVLHPRPIADDEEVDDASEFSSGAEESIEVEDFESVSEHDIPPDGRQELAVPDDATEDAKATAKVPKNRITKQMTLTTMHKKGKEETEDEVRARLEALLPPGEKLEKRKGPGRPPANGIMSKRAISEYIKAQKARDAGSAAGVAADLAKSSGAADADDEGASKMKSKKRKRSDSDVGGKGKDPPGKAKEETPRSPSPTEDQFTPAQLEKPELTYALMIYKILKDVEPTELNLQQLYKEVKTRWPYFRFKKDTTGWESSVRHTIKQHYFKQGERDGKGYKYTINSDVEPPTQKSKPAPSTTQPAPYANGSYPRPPQYPPYGSHPHAGGYRPPYPQPPYSYSLQGQRPQLNGNTLPGQYQTQYSQQPGSLSRPLGSQTLPQASSTIPPVGNQGHSRSDTPTNAQFGAAQATANLQATTSIPNHSNTANATVTHPSTASMPASIPSGPLQQTHQMGSPASNQPAHNGGVAPAKAPSLFQNSLSASPSPRPPSAVTGATQGNATNNGLAIQRPPSTQTISGPAPPPMTAASPTGVRPLPSEEIQNGRVPQVLTDFVNNMKKMCKDLPTQTVNESVRRAEDAIDWVMRNLHGNPADEPGKSHLWRHLVGLVQDTISVHDKQERARRGEPAPDTTQATAQPTASPAT